MKIESDSGSNQIEENTNINELSIQGVSANVDENILADHFSSHAVVEKQLLIDEEINASKLPETIFNNPQLWLTLNNKMYTECCNQKF